MLVLSRLGGRSLLLALALCAATGTARAAETGAVPDPDSLYIREHYTKIERLVPMRDGVRLFTSIYLPRDASRPVPILLQRTPYSVAPYGEDDFKTRLGPSMSLVRDGYIVVYQDVRGKYLSEGTFEAVRPVRSGASDESTDAYDTVEWLLRNVPGHNGRVGVWGVSAPGFYATQALIGAHPAVRAVSPQAPVTDWFLGDDRHHNGAFQLQASFSFLSSYGAPRPEPTTLGAAGFRAYGTPDGYRWYLDQLTQGSVAEMGERLLGPDNAVWNSMVAHPTYDAFWKARTPLPHLRGVTPAVLVVGGFFDAQNLYGPLKTYHAVEDHSPETPSYLVMGPWWHGGWAGGPGDRYGDLYFGRPTAEDYRERIERPFFNAFLQDDDAPDLPEASIFLTGDNEWRAFSAWPPTEAHARRLYLEPGGGLAFEAPTAAGAFAEYVSDPTRPVPNTSQVVVTRDDRYLIQDQRFASTRPDVLVFASPVLDSDVTLAGDLVANLFVSTTGTDADFVVKLIDVYPGTARCELPDAPCSVPMGGFEQMVRGEVMRARFRNSFERPEALVPGEVTQVRFDMQDVAHTFRAGHRMMVQVQSSWFPMVDLNPQRFVDIPHASPADRQVATHRVYVSAEHPSHLEVKVLD